MSKKTGIQWCHSTVNPAMGCDGCELWPRREKVISTLTDHILAGHQALGNTRAMVSGVVGQRLTSEIYADREAIATELVTRLNLNPLSKAGLVDVIRNACKCYAGLLGTMRAGHKGYADQFEIPKLYPGRMSAAAHWSTPSASEQSAKPWLRNTPRMIFISDMGDALSRGIPFEYLQKEIIDVVATEAGSQQLWLWLSKRPARMAEFGRWLLDRDILWPDNLVAMTTVTSPASAGRVAELRRVPCKLKGLSCEPLFAGVQLNLTGIDWLITGGGSDVLAEPFHVEWALDLRRQCRNAGTAFFLKQLGKVPTFKGQPLALIDHHGGDWNEWPVADWRTREIPAAFQLQIACPLTESVKNPSSFPSNPSNSQ